MTDQSSSTDHRITGDPQQGKSRGAGWEFVHVAIDDASRIPSARSCLTKRSKAPLPFSGRRLHASLDVTVTRVMTDNGSCYRARAFAKACRRLGLRHVRTRPYTPRPTARVERFIQTALRECAYADSYPNSHHRATELPIWLHQYNWIVRTAA